LGTPGLVSLFRGGPEVWGLCTVTQTLVPRDCLRLAGRVTLHRSAQSPERWQKERLETPSLVSLFRGGPGVGFVYCYTNSCPT